MPVHHHRKRSDEEWTTLIKAYLASGLTQRAFCQQNGLSFHSFRRRYQHSPLFRGRRRRRPAAGFQPVVLHEAPPPTAEGWVVRCGDQVRIECPADTPVDAIVRLARGLAHVA